MKENTKNTTSTRRQSNIELCRIVSILLVMILHSTYNAVIVMGGGNFLLYYISALSIIGVNVFVMITGYFSTTPKKTSLINLTFICLFWAIVKAITHLFLGLKNSYADILFLTNANWFIPCYIGLIFMAPIFNAYCEKASKKQLLGGGIFSDYNTSVV